MNAPFDDADIAARQVETAADLQNEPAARRNDDGAQFLADRRPYRHDWRPRTHSTGARPVPASIAALGLAW